MNEQETKVIETTEIVNQSNFTQASNSFKLSEEETDSIQLYTRWAKFYAILSYIGGGFYILSGVPAILLFGLGFIYIAIGVFIIWLAKLIWDSAQNAKIASEATSNEDFRTNAIASIQKAGRYYQITGILTIATFILLFFGIILLIVVGFSSSSALFNSLNDINLNSPANSKNLSNI
jgi:hypothetical protein